MAKKSIDDQMEKLNDIRTDIDNKKSAKQRIEGKLENLRKSQSDAESEIKRKFGCDPSALPAMIVGLEKEASDNIASAEAILEGKS